MVLLEATIQRRICKTRAKAWPTGSILSLTPSDMYADPDSSQGSIIGYINDSIYDGRAIGFQHLRRQCQAFARVLQALFYGVFY
jgi:hypothetical protein